VYRAVVEGLEVMTLQELEDEATVRPRIDHPDLAAAWMSRAGFGAYPTLFAGTVMHAWAMDAAK
jgi:hypothetical protein